MTASAVCPEKGRLPMPFLFGAVFVSPDGFLYVFVLLKVCYVFICRKKCINVIMWMTFNVLYYNMKRIKRFYVVNIVLFLLTECYKFFLLKNE